MVTYTSGKTNLEKPAYGDYSSNATGWTNAINANWDAIDSALNGLASINVTTSNYTLSASEARNFRIFISGAANALSVIFPAGKSGLWMCTNNTSYAITFIMSGGTGVAVASGKSALLYGGTNMNVVDTTNLPITGGTISGNLAVAGTFGATGAATLSNTLAVTGATTLTGNLTIRSGTSERNILIGSSGAYIYGNSTVVGIWSPTSSSGVGLDVASGQFYMNKNASVGTDLYFNSGYGSAAKAYGCRAWVNFNGTGTVAIRGSGNVSSITDLGTGQYQVNFASGMPDGNYNVVAATVYQDNITYYPALIATPANYTTGNFKVATIDNNVDNYSDAAIVNLSVYR